ncbi:hypothetical protein CROQUDRAFT_132370 [Cronartium quercuum f. sp. fusiforme G11]|uniref:Uncharacterized protein n=1 Tax=Cronartium quercuum f. sp. fusiforme G11 TaxID=708437 RepID=A0A9P6NLJ1_9BASI|nr:hypothetical protein CROQUDRAFT_132370 [Cronartium quercuum f. sp. fusiforme G11]
MSVTQAIDNKADPRSLITDLVKRVLLLNDLDHINQMNGFTKPGNEIRKADWIAKKEAERNVTRSNNAYHTTKSGMKDTTASIAALVSEEMIRLHITHDKYVVSQIISWLYSYQDHLKI